jgi:hypothetical protein
MMRTKREEVHNLAYTVPTALYSMHWCGTHAEMSSLINQKLHCELLMQKAEVTAS